MLSNQEPILNHFFKKTVFPPSLQRLKAEMNYQIIRYKILENSILLSLFSLIQKTLSTPPFIHIEGPTDETDILIEISPFSVFKLLFTNEVIEHITFHTNLYCKQKYQKIGKAYKPMTFDEISFVIGMNLLMGIKKQCSY